MLSSRYLHLHQALGLGPMWLNRHAKVIPPAGDASVTQPQKPTAAQVAEAVRTISASAHHARMAAMAAVQHEKPPPQQHPPSRRLTRRLTRLPHPRGHILHPKTPAKLPPKPFQTTSHACKPKRVRPKSSSSVSVPQPKTACTDSSFTARSASCSTICLPPSA